MMEPKETTPVPARPQWIEERAALQQRVAELEALRESDARYRAFFENAAVAVTIVDRNGYITEVNEADCRFLGYSCSELIGARLAQFTHPEDLLLDVDLYESLWKGQRHRYEVDKRYIRKDGTVVWGHFSVSLVSACSRASTCAMVICEDITERKQAEEALRYSGEQYRQVVSMISDIIWRFEVDAQGQFVSSYVSPVADRMLGLPSGTIGDNFDAYFSYVHPEDLPAVQERLFSALASPGGEAAAEYRLQRADGTVCWVRSHGSAHLQPDGHIIAFGTTSDITERRRTGEFLRLQALVLDQIKDHVTITDLSGVITYVNQAEVETFGLSRQEILGRPTDIYGEDAERGGTQQEIVTQTLREGFWRGEVVNFATDGSEHIMDCRTQVVRDEYGAPVALCGISTDITDRKEAEMALRESEERYRATFNAVDDYIHGVDCDLRILFCNTAFVEALNKIGIFEDPHDQLLFDLLPFLSEHSRAEYQEVLMTGVMLTTEEATQFGEVVRWTETRKIPIRDQDGQTSRVVTIIRDITERKHAEESLRKLSEEQALLLDTMETQVWYLSDVGTYGMANRAHAEFLGLSKEEIKGRKLTDLLPEAVAQGCLAANHQVFATKEIVHSEEWSPNAEGGVRLLAITKTPKLDQNGDVEYVVCVGVDVTERKRTEEALLTNARRWQQAQTIAKIGNWEFDMATGQIWGSEEAFRIYGIELDRAENPHQILPLDRVEACIPERQRTHQALIDVIDKNMPYDLEYEVIRDLDARRIVLHSVAARVYDDQGQLVKIAGTIQDVTATKHMEQALRESLEKYRVLFEVFPLGITISDEAGHILEINRASERLLGLSAWEHGQRQIDGTEWQIVRLDGSPMPAEEFASVRALAESRMIQNVEMGIIRPDEDIVWINVTAAPIPLDGYGVAVTYGDITERVQAQNALRKREAHFRTLFEHAGDAIFIEDDADHIINANRRACELLGYAREELLHMTIADLQAPERRGPIGSIIKSELSEYNGQPFTTVDMRKDGTRVPVEVTTVRLSPDEGSLALSIVRDISERVQTQQALQWERDLFSALAEAAAAVNSTLDPDEVLERLLEQVSRVVSSDAGNVMLVENGNHVRIARCLGYERFDAEAFVPTIVFTLDDVPNLLEMVKTGAPKIIPDVTAYPGWVHVPAQAWLRSYAGVPIRVRGVVVGFLNMDSATPGFFTPQHADILRAFADHAAIALENARLYHAAQQELAERTRAERALRESEERYRRLFERSNDAIFLVDRYTGRYQEANEAAERLTGRSVTELQHLTALDIAPEGAQERLGQILTARHTLEMGEVHYLRPDGVTRTALLDVVPLNDQTVFSIVRDITEHKEIEERLRRQERLAAVGQLAAGIAHDFRNLLTTIILYAQLGRRKVGFSSTVAQYLEIIVGESHKATDLVQQILDFSSRTTIDRHPLDLVDFVGSVIAVLRRTLPENIHITLNVESGPLIVEGDAGRLQQALTNLALNARDAMLEGGTLAIEVTRVAVEPGAVPLLPEMVEIIAPPAWICLSVSDTGCGMTEAVRGHLFEPFFTTKEEGQGTGLGLAQVYGIVRLHAGYIDVVTEVGKGTTFRIYLPASALAVDDAAETTATAPSGHGETLLLVEDNENLREAGEHILTALGYRVLTAENGREALDVYRAEGSIALLLTDLVMPEMGGKALVLALRRYVPDLKALAMTGYTAEESVESLRAAGFLEIIRKPFDVDTLARTVRRVLDGG